MTGARRWRVSGGNNRREIARSLQFAPIHFAQTVIQNIMGVQHRYANLTERYTRIAIDLSGTDNPKPRGTPYAYNGSTLRAMRKYNGVGKWKRKRHVPPILDNG